MRKIIIVLIGAIAATTLAFGTANAMPVKPGIAPAVSQFGCRNHKTQSICFTAFELRVVNRTAPENINSMVFRTRIRVDVRPYQWNMTGRFFKWNKAAGKWLEYQGVSRWDLKNLPASGKSVVLLMPYRVCIKGAFMVRLIQTGITAKGVTFTHKIWYFPWAGFTANTSNWTGDIEKEPALDESYRPDCHKPSVLRTG